MSSPVRNRHRGAYRSRGSIRLDISQYLADEPLAGMAHKDRATEFVEPIDPPQELQIVRHRLSKPDTRVERDTILSQFRQSRERRDVD